MALYSSDRSGRTGLESGRSFDFLSSSIPQFGQEAKAFYRAPSAEVASPAASPALGSMLSGEGTAALFSDPIQQRRNTNKLAGSALENYAILEGERRRSEAQSAASASAAQGAQQASTMGVVGAGIAATGTIVAAALI